MTSHRTPRNRHRRPAFTLLEIMCSLLAISTLLGSLYMCLNIAVRTKESTLAAVTPVRAAVIAGDTIRQDFEAVLPPTGILAGLFVGSSQGGGGSGEMGLVQFCTVGNDPTLINAPGGIENPLAEGVRKVEIGVRTDLTPPVLVRRVTRNLLSQVEPAPDEEVLCRNVKTFALRYYDGLTWQDQWDSSTMGDVLPVAVEMTLELNNPLAKPGEQAVYRITRMFPLPCAKPPADDAAAEGGGQ